MSEPAPGRPMDDGLDQAYARSHALADDGRGPAATVRANVLAAAARIAAGEAADAAPRGPLVAVAPPVAAVGRRRAAAVNLSSWQVRSGAALCALLLVCAGVWRFDQNGRLGGGLQVALAELRLAEPRTAPAAAPQELPVPAAAAASYPYVAPTAVVVDPFDGSAGVRGPVARHAERERDVVVAQLDERRAAAAAAPRTAAQADSLPPSARAAMQAPARTSVEAYAPPPPAALAANTPRPEGKPTEQEAATVTIAAAVPAAPPVIMTEPLHAPSVLPRRMTLVQRPASAPPARPAPAGNTVVASTDAGAVARDLQRAEASPAAAPIAQAKAAPAKPDSRLPSEADVLKRSKTDAAGLLPASARPDSLQAAADRGDVDALKALLAAPAVRVDAPDADGRTALLHAVLAQRPAAVRLLLAAGADPGHADRAGLTPRQAAQVGASAEIAALLGAAR